LTRSVALTSCIKIATQLQVCCKNQNFFQEIFFFICNKMKEELYAPLKSETSPRVMNPLFVLVMGVSGCGKSSVGNALVRSIPGSSFIEGDDFHPMSNIQKMSNGIPLNDDDRFPWLNRLNQELLKYAIPQSDDAPAWPVTPHSSSLLVVLACSALKESYRRILFQNIPSAQSRIVFLDGSYDFIYKHMSQRQGHFMKENMLRSQFNTLERPMQNMTQDGLNVPVLRVGLEETAHKSVDEVAKLILERLHL
jgi:gluconokinase